jgi:hypothetical protein
MSNALKFSVSASCPVNTSIPLLLSFSDTQGMTWTETIPLTVVEKNKDIVIEDPARDCVVSHYSGNNDGIVNPGESFNYAITIKNTGTLSRPGLQGVLSTTASNVTLDTSSVSVGALEPGASGTASYRFTVGASCPPGTVIPFALAVTSSGGTIWELAPPAVTVRALTPQNVQAVADSMNSVSLSWDSVSGASGYRVYCAASETGSYTLAGSPTGTSYPHTGRTPGTVYYYRVSAVGSAGSGGESERSAAVAAKTWMGLVFNKAASGTVAAGLPDYYRFYVSSGVAYTFTSDKSGTVLWESGGTSWFTLNSGSQPQTPGSSGWAFCKFESAGAYTFTVKSGEAAVSGFSIGSSVGTINEAAKTIAVIVPYDTNLASLTPTVTPAADWTCATTGAKNFSGPVEYRFTNSAGQAQAYTVTVTRRGQGGITMVFPTDTANGAITNTPITLSKNGTPKTTTLTVSGDFDTYRWRVDGSIKGNTKTIILDAANYQAGTHQITLEVTRDGAVYSKTGSFTVQN